jgi:tRNA threonylcarbamoyladenosine modification (KEOPS) complex Cgi121 subunit
MIVKDFYIKAMDLRYFVGINQIKLDINQFLKANSITNEQEALNRVFDIIDELQNKDKESTIQFVKNKYVLNQDQIFMACYYMQKAFLHKTHISNKKNIELLLYLSASRQISKGFDTFGIEYSDLKEGNIIICIISPEDNIDEINKEILQIFHAREIDLTIDNLTVKKINTIIDNYEISDLQIKSVLNSYGNKNYNIKDYINNLEPFSLALFDLLCEKMALLNIEKIKMK